MEQEHSLSQYTLFSVRWLVRQTGIGEERLSWYPQLD